MKDYFVQNDAVPFMEKVFDIKKEKQNEIPAVTHVDGTGRLQTVSKETNPLYYDLINKFYKITEVPVIVNTSMNVMGEPIVTSPEEAFKMWARTDMDNLVMGNYLISENLIDEF